MSEMEAAPVPPASDAGSDPGAAPEASPGAGVETRWFAADDLLLAVEAPAIGVDPALATLADAVLLDERAPLLDCLDAWCGRALDWRPIAPDAPSVLGIDPGRSVALESEAGAARRVTVLPVRGAALPPPPLPAPWSALVAHRPRRRSATLVLETLELSADDLRRLGPGALVLLPGAFRDVWAVTLETADGTALRARLDRADDVVRVMPPDGSEVRAPECGDAFRAGVRRARLLAAGTLEVDTAALEAARRGAGDAPAVALDGLLERPATLELDPAPDGASRRWRGTLARVGAGLALRIEPVAGADAPDAYADVAVAGTPSATPDRSAGAPPDG